MTARRDSEVAGLLAHLEVGAACQPNALVHVGDVWDAWQLAAVESALALDMWMSAEPEERALNYYAYVACLDREEQAAITFAGRVDPAAAKRLRARG
jgi:hypothetical protein